jgi:hypothetical protein
MFKRIFENVKNNLTIKIHKEINYVDLLELRWKS